MKFPTGAGNHSVQCIDKLYGPDNARIMLDACATKVTLAAADLATAKYISESLGTQTITVTSESRTPRPGLWAGSTVTRTKSAHARQLLTPDEVRQIGKDQAIVISDNARPLLLTKAFYNPPPRRQRKMKALGAALTFDLPPVPEERKSSVHPPPVPDDL